MCLHSPCDSRKIRFRSFRGDNRAAFSVRFVTYTCRGVRDEYRWFWPNTVVLSSASIRKVSEVSKNGETNSVFVRHE